MGKSLRFRYKQRIFKMIDELEARKQACLEAVDGICLNCGHTVGAYPNGKVMHTRKAEYSVTCWKCECRNAELS